MMQDAVTEFLIAAVENAPLDPEPFDHIYFQAFTADVYATLLRNLPPLDRHLDLRHKDAMRPDGRSTRRRLFLYPETLRFLSESQRRYWLALSRALRASDLQAAFKRKFRTALENRFGKSVDRLSFRPVPILVRDLDGYRIGIHSDTPRKAITVQFYLPRDNSQEHLGTHLHGDNEGQTVKTLAFTPASAYAFPVLRTESFHSVPSTTAADGERNSIMLTYYVTGTLRESFDFWRGRWREHRAHRRGEIVSPLV